MSWQCQTCKAVNVNPTKGCVYCFHRLHKLSPRPEGVTLEYDDYDETLFKCISTSIDKTLWKVLNFTEQKMADDLFAQFFATAREKVKDMDDAALIEWQQQLAKICTESKAYLYAIDDERRDRTAKRKQKEGFSRSVTIDDESANIIKGINESRKRQSKTDKAIASLKALGMSDEEVNSMMSKGSGSKEKQNAEVLQANLETAVAKAIEPLQVNYEAPKPFVNPFQK